MKIFAFFTAFFLLLSLPAQAAEIVTYHDGDTILEGYFVPAQCGAEKAPVILVIHQWMGPGAHERERAEWLAASCYNAFVIDMYGQNIRPANKDEAAAQAGLYKQDAPLARRRVKAALDYVRGRDDVDPARVAVIGFCFGGTMALELARSGEEFAAAISFHGGLDSAEPVTRPGTVKPSLQIHHGAADPLVPLAEIEAFVKEMDMVRADWVFTAYAGAVHSFTEKSAGNNPATGAAYDAAADQRSWTYSLAFLREKLAP